MPLLPARGIIVPDESINFYWKSIVNTSINTTIQFPHLRPGRTSAVELCGPGFVFIGTKLWYASVSNVSARIECHSPETWSPLCSREILDTVLSLTMWGGSPGTTSLKEIKSKCITVVYLHTPNTDGTCVQTYLLWILQDLSVKAPHIRTFISVTENNRQRQRTFDLLQSCTVC